MKSWPSLLLDAPQSNVHLDSQLEPLIGEIWKKERNKTLTEQGPIEGLGLACGTSMVGPELT